MKRNSEKIKINQKTPKDKQKKIRTIKKRKKIKQKEIRIICKKKICFKKSLGQKNKFKNYLSNENIINKGNNRNKIQRILCLEICPKEKDSKISVQKSLIDKNIIQLNVCNFSLNQNEKHDGKININNLIYNNITNSTNSLNINKNTIEDVKILKNFMNETVYSFENTNKILELLLYHNTIDDIFLNLYKQRQNDFE